MRARLVLFGLAIALVAGSTGTAANAKPPTDSAETDDSIQVAGAVVASAALMLRGDHARPSKSRKRAFIRVSGVSVSGAVVSGTVRWNKRMLAAPGRNDRLSTRLLASGKGGTVHILHSKSVTREPFATVQRFKLVLPPKKAKTLRKSVKTTLTFTQQYDSPDDSDRLYELNYVNVVQLKAPAPAWGSPRGPARPYESVECHPGSSRIQIKSGANLTGCDLRGADLAGANLNGATMLKTRLEGAKLNNADMGSAYMYEAAMIGVQARGTNFYRSNLVHANLSGGDFTRASFHRTDFMWVTAQYANFEEANLTESSLSEADFKGSQMNAAKFADSHANFIDMRYVEFRQDPAGGNLFARLGHWRSVDLYRACYSGQLPWAAVRSSFVFATPPSMPECLPRT